MRIRDMIRKVFGFGLITVSKPGRGRSYGPHSSKYFIWGYVDDDLYSTRIKLKWNTYLCKITDFNRGETVMYCPKEHQDGIHLEDCYPGIVIDHNFKDNKLLVRFKEYPDEVRSNIAIPGTEGFYFVEKLIDPEDLKVRI